MATPARCPSSGGEHLSEATLMRHWGKSSICDCPHLVRPKDLSSVRWIHLGHDATPRSCDEWFDPDYRFPDAREEWFASWKMFYSLIWGDQDEASRVEYFMKIPGEETAVPVTERARWHLAMGGLGKMLYMDTGLWCPKDRPVVIVCTEKQARRCAARDWEDCVQIEARRGEDTASDGSDVETTDARDVAVNSAAPPVRSQRRARRMVMTLFGPVPAPDDTSEDEGEDDARHHARKKQETGAHRQGDVLVKN
ncbi:hypothetical protein EsDP_00001509 [Epichloe bromicola]|uniref:Uncharacterized protein n=1 Tax=Epichloe bromicola TaxID=79588 RepID=A0ABQ0CI23_9HYPO